MEFKSVVQKEMLYKDISYLELLQRTVVICAMLE